MAPSKGGLNWTTSEKGVDVPCSQETNDLLLRAQRASSQYREQNKEKKESIIKAAETVNAAWETKSNGGSKDDKKASDSSKGRGNGNGSNQNQNRDDKRGGRGGGRDGGRGGGRGGYNATNYKPNESPGKKQKCKCCIHTPLVCKAIENVSDVDTTSSTCAIASVSVSKLAYDTDPCCDSGSHCEIGECKECSVTDVFGDEGDTDCVTCDDVIYILKNLATNNQPTHLSPAAISHNGFSISIGALLDTGALQVSYMSTRVAEALEKEAGLHFDTCSTRVCTAFNNCEIADKMSNLSIIFVNNKVEHLITFKVLEIPYDVIIGRKDMWRHSLWPRYAPYPYNMPYNEVLENPSASTPLLYQSEPNNNSELNKLSAPIRKGEESLSKKCHKSKLKSSKTNAENHPHRTVEQRESGDSEYNIERKRVKNLSTNQLPPPSDLAIEKHGVKKSTLAPKQASGRKQGVSKSTGRRDDDYWEATISEAAALNSLEQEFGLATAKVAGKPPREKKVQKIRESELHSSSIFREEPKKALTEAQAKEADRYLELWEVTTEEELNAFLSMYVKSTTGNANSGEAELKRASINTFLQREEEGEGLSVRGAELPEYDTSTTGLRSSDAEIPKATTNYIPRNLEANGVSKSFAKKMEKICTAHLPVFNTKLNVQPANVPPMELEVDDAKWKVPANQGPPRNQTHLKQQAVKKAINEMCGINVISPTDMAEYYSHPHLVPKPPPSTDWRFAIDFRGLNLASGGCGWPIPNIPQMLQRLGEKKPKFLGKLDFTSGYHQAPLSAEARIYTAFMTFMGTYVWNRVPMGIKRAGGWFQAMLVTVVFVGLIYIICELYIDDLIIHAQTEDEFCNRLDQVLTRLQARGITVNPDKCLLGVRSLEFVGHTISEEGLHFTRDKIEKVLQIPEPTVGKQLKSFLGVAVWFIEHIEGYSELARPLHQMLKDYDKSRALKWTDEGRTAFHNLKEAINNCPMLYFIDDTSPIFVETDASDYGVGGVCYQLIDGKRRYIAFVSHSLSKDGEINWSVPHKEMYGIVYTLSKLDYLLRDRQFTLKTDHKNLISMHTDKNPKVFRWKIAIQDYDATIEYIEGPKNVIADGLSRLLPTSNVNKDQGKKSASSIDPDSYFESPSDDPEANYKSIDSLEVMYHLVAEELAQTRGYSPSVIAFGFATLMEPETLPFTLQEEINLVGEMICEELNVTREMIIPVASRALIAKCHNALVGHMGVEKTVEKLQRLGHSWTHMREHVKKFIRECPYCQKMSYLKTPVHTHPFTTAAYGPWQRLNIDSIGPLSMSAEGYCHILVIICCFSRWVELIPMKSTEMIPTKKELIKVFGTFGEPAQVLRGQPI